MRPILYNLTEQAFTSNGLGTLDAITCTVEEQRNGFYELEMTIAGKTKHASELEVGKIILAKPNKSDDPEPFRIYEIEKNLNGVWTIHGRHISYDLSRKFLNGKTASTCGEALALLETASGSPWTFTTDKSAAVADFSVPTPFTVRSCMAGREGSILDVYAPGEWHYNHFTCEYLSARGQDRGVIIRYGKNLTALKSDIDITNVYSKVSCYWLNQETGGYKRGAAVSTGVPNEGVFGTLLVDMSQKYTGTVPTLADLEQDATDYIAAHDLTSPKVNFTLGWVQSGQIIDTIDLCDEVSVVYEDFGITAKAKCIRTKWNVLLDRYDEIEIGDLRSTLASSLSSIPEKIKETKEEVQEGYAAAIKTASALITGAAGGYVVFWNSTTQEPGTASSPANEILIMDTPSVDTATKVWRWNLSGLGYSETGYDGTYRTAIDMNGGLATWFIDTVRLNADMITVGTLQGVRIIGEMGSIGGWKITSNLIEKWSDYEEGTPATVYRAFMSAPAHPQDNYLAFGIEVYNWDGHNLTLAGQPFRVRYDGKMTATDGTFEGTIRARSGEISGDINLSGSLSAQISGGGDITLSGAGLVGTGPQGDKMIYAAGGILMFAPGSTLYDAFISLSGSALQIRAKDELYLTSENDKGIVYNSHSTPIGSVKVEKLSSALSLTGGSPHAVVQIILDPGVWLVFAYAKWNAVSGGGGARYINIASNQDQANARIRNDTYNAGNIAQQLECSGYLVVKQQTPYYLNAYTDNTSTLNATYTQITAIRLL